MRTIHRLLSLVALLFMLWLGVTGSLIQMMDLQAILSHAPETDPVMTSIDEGKEGNGDFAVRSGYDMTAQPLPAGVDYPRAFATIVQALHTHAPAASIRFAELRMNGGRMIGQIATGPISGYPEYNQSLAAFDPTTGAPVAFVHVSPAQPAHSLREDLKEWHRFFTRSNPAGTYLTLVVGIVLWVMIITGLVFYVQQLLRRRAMGRTQLFWSAGGWWRSLHRWISVVSCVVLMVLATTGSFIGLESSLHNFRADPGPDFSAPMTDVQVAQQVKATLHLFREAEPQTPIKVLRVRLYSGYKQGVVITGGNTMIDGETTRQLVYNTDNGQLMSLTEPGYAPNQFPFGLQMHENMKHLHEGFMLGTWSRFFYLLGGLGLVYLSASGLVMYVNMWRARARVGRTNPVWL